LRFSEIGRSLTRGTHLSAVDSHAEAHLSEPPLPLAPRAMPCRAPLPRQRSRCVRRGQDGPVRSCAVTLSNAASRLTSCANPDSPGPSLSRLTAVTPTFYKNKNFAHIGVPIKCISNCSTYEKLSKNKSCIGCIACHGILYFSKILEEPRRI
jgi:hypothetical protein